MLKILSCLIFSFLRGSSRVNLHRIFPFGLITEPETLFPFLFRSSGKNETSSRTEDGHIHKCELVLIHLCYMGVSSFAGDLINSVIWLEEASNSTCVTSVAGLCLRIRVAHNQAALSVYPVSGQWDITPGDPHFPSKQFEPEDNWERFRDKQQLRARHTPDGPGSFVLCIFFRIALCAPFFSIDLEPLS